MRRRRMGFEQRLIVRAIAGGAALESFFAALQGIIDHRADHSALWLGAFAMAFSLAFIVEKIKAEGGPS